MASIDEDGTKRLWAVAIGTIRVGQVDPLNATRWHNTREWAIEYAKDAHRRGHKVLSITGWQEFESVDLGRELTE